jgi:hypothetical protein
VSHRAVTAALVAAALSAALAASFRPVDATAAATDCVTLPAAGPLWVEYGDGSVPTEVRAVFSRPGVVVASTGVALPAKYRGLGARTTYFILKLPTLVGDPGKPSDPATIDTVADAAYDRAVASTACEQPWIALNELAGPAAPVPWTDTVRAYRANILQLMRRLAERGAVPVLFVHGSPVYTGEAKGWWKEVGATGHIVYESYYKAPGIIQRGRIIGPRRLRLGMRSVINAFANAGVPRDHLGVVLGFQVAPGKSGREGLQPSTDWFRFVKWNAGAARQVAQDEGIASIWSWGWGNLSAAAKDPDKPAAACVYLWARDQSLCDGKAVAGPGFNASLVEGPIVMADSVYCLSVVGKLPKATVTEHSTYLRNLDAAVSATFVRQVLRKRLPIPQSEIDAAENDVIATTFGGSRAAYLAELRAQKATTGVARGILEDALRRERITELVGPTGVLPWIADAVTSAIDTATCRRDRLPGRGNFPVTDRRESSGVPLGAALPFLLADTTAPVSPIGVVAAGTSPTITLDWEDPAEPDVLGYLVDRAPTADGPFTALTTQPWPRSYWNDPKAPVGAFYRVRAVDAAGNISAPVVVPSVVPLPPPTP